MIKKISQFANTKCYDERELQIRGNVFMHSWLFACFLLAISSSISPLFYNESSCVIMLLYLMVFQTGIELVLRGGIGQLNKNVKIAFNIIFLSGAFLVVMGIIEDNAFFIDGKITESATYMFNGILLLITGLVYHLKSHVDKIEN